MPDKKALSDAAFSRDALTYDQSSKYSPLRAMYPLIVAEALRSPFHAALDVGCGTGELLRLVHAERKTAKLYGVDLSEEMISAARTKLGIAAELRVADSEKLPFKDSVFDLVTCTFSFHHYPSPRAVLREIRRVLSQQGKLIVADPSIFPPLRQVFNLLTPFSKDGAVRYYSRKEMNELASSAGLRVVRWSKLNWHSYMLVADRNVRKDASNWSTVKP